MPSVNFAASAVRRRVRGQKPHNLLKRASLHVVETLEERTLMSAWYTSTTGSDANLGTLQSPFKTIQKAALMAQAGDSVLIRGGTYRETVTPPRSGAAGAPISFAAYNGEQVTISGADPITGWGANGNSVFRAGMNWTRGTGDDQVFVDGQMMIYARYPNTSLDVSRPVKLTADSGSGNRVGDVSTGRVTDSDLNQASGYWTGATVHIAAGQGFVQHSATVTDSSPGSVTFTYNSSNDAMPQAGNLYFIDNSFKALDAPGEWYRDPSTGNLYLQTPQSDNPSSHVVEAKRRDFAFDLSGRSYIEVNGLDLFAATITSSTSSSHLTIDGISAKYVSHFNMVPSSAWVTAANDTGIMLYGSFNEIRNSEIAYSAGNGILLAGTDSRATNNVIHDVDYAATDAAGINTGELAYTSRRQEISHNTIYNSGRGLIVFRSLKGGKVNYNNVYSGGLQTNDLGGLYTLGIDGEGTEIAYNTVHDIYSAVPGVGGFGIYFDNGTSNFVVHNNLVYNVGTALMLNTPGSNHQVFNNTLLGAMSVDSWPRAPLPNTVLTNNIFGAGLNLDPSVALQNNIYAGTDPLFVDPSTLDFRLQAVSLAIDAGKILSLPGSLFSGRAPDVGAFEYGATAWQSGPIGDGAPPLPPAAPDEASTAVSSDTEVRLDWTDNSDGEQGFTIERASDGTNFTVAGVVGPDVNFFLDTGLEPTVKYTYRVRADNSAYSNLVTATTLRGATSRIQAEWTERYSGISVDKFGIGSLDDNEWAMYRQINFGAGVTDFSAIIGVPPASAGKTIEIHVDGVSGLLLGTLTVASTGAWGIQTTQTTRLTGSVTGWHDVYLVFKGGWGVGYLDSFRFGRAAVTTLRASNFDSMKGVGNDGASVGSLDTGDWIRYGNVDFSTGSVQRFNAKVGVPSANAGNQIEVHVGSPTGKLVATLAVAATGGYSTISLQSTRLITTVSGLQDVFLFIKGGWGVANLESFSFS